MADALKSKDVAPMGDIFTPTQPHINSPSDTTFEDYLSTIHAAASGGCDKPGSPLPGVNRPLVSPTSSEPIVVDHAVINQVCILYFFGAWGKRMWEFAGIVFIMEIFPGSLLASSVFGLLETIASMLWGPAMGRYIDRNQRLKVIRLSIVGQNFAIIFAAVVLAFALGRHAEHWELPNRVVVLALLVVATGVAKLSSSLNKIGLQKDWAVIISKSMTDGKQLQRNQTAPLTIFNARMHRVDLSCSILAPLMVGVASSMVNPSFAVIVVGIWSGVSTVVEMYLSQSVFSKIPSLWHKEIKAPAPASTTTTKANGNSTMDNLKAYVSHPCFLAASLPYCLLYISVLSFGGIMTSFLRTVGCPDIALAGGRGAGAAFAIGGTIAVPKMMRFFAGNNNNADGGEGGAVMESSSRRAALIKSALIMLWWQILSLIPLVTGFMLFSNRFQELGDDRADSPVFLPFMSMIFISLCSSRLGLWGFDLAQTQLMQETVDVSEAGRINGSQQTLMEACYLFSFMMTIAFPDPRTFFIPAFLSFASIFVAALLFTMFRHRLQE
jgi:iron-regulated transporter 1